MQSVVTLSMVTSFYADFGTFFLQKSHLSSVRRWASYLITFCPFLRPPFPPSLSPDAVSPPLPPIHLTRSPLFDVRVRGEEGCPSPFSSWFIDRERERERERCFSINVMGRSTKPSSWTCPLCQVFFCGGRCVPVVKSRVVQCTSTYMYVRCAN